MQNWSLDKSYYRKLRLSAAWVAKALADAGLAIVSSEIEDGQITIIASKPHRQL
ncbi:MAG: hypothetical protein WD002_02905 [Pseudomonadales bacterium]